MLDLHAATCSYTGHQLRVQIKEIKLLILMHVLLDLQQTALHVEQPQKAPNAYRAYILFYWPIYDKNRGGPAIIIRDAERLCSTKLRDSIYKVHDLTPASSPAQQVLQAKQQVALHCPNAAANDLQLLSQHLHPPRLPCCTLYCPCPIMATSAANRC
jgi:hypothetical protein